MCRQFVRVFSQVSAKQKRSSPCLLLAAVQSLVHSWEAEKLCQVHCVASWESLGCRREKRWSHPQRKRVSSQRKTLQSRRDLYSQPFPRGAKKAWEGSGRLGAGEKTHACLPHTGNTCCLPAFNGRQPPPSCIPKHQQIME